MKIIMNQAGTQGFVWDTNKFVFDEIIENGRYVSTNIIYRSKALGDCIVGEFDSTYNAIYELQEMRDSEEQTYWTKGGHDGRRKTNQKVQ